MERGYLNIGGKAEVATSASQVNPKTVSEIARIQLGLSVGRDLASRVHALVGVLCGPSPEVGREAADRVDGVLPNVADQADDTVSAVGNALAALVRLERAFSL